MKRQLTGATTQKAAIIILAVVRTSNLTKKLPAFYGNRNFFAALTGVCHLNPHLHIVFQIYFNINISRGCQVRSLAYTEKYEL
jgi:hypothetical protein